MRGRIVGGVVVGSPAHRFSEWLEGYESVAHTSRRRFLLWRCLKALLVVLSFVWFFGSQWVVWATLSAIFGPDVDLLFVFFVWSLSVWLLLYLSGAR